jgi:hypothetical protein
MSEAKSLEIFLIMNKISPENGEFLFAADFPKDFARRKEKIFICFTDVFSDGEKLLI